jgi:hypothetical protein
MAVGELACQVAAKFKHDIASYLSGKDVVVREVLRLTKNSHRDADNHNLSQTLGIRGAQPAVAENHDYQGVLRQLRMLPGGPL